MSLSPDPRVGHLERAFFGCIATVAVNRP